jgi:predicted phage terminase large subunit-like protein
VTQTLPPITVTKAQLEAQLCRRSYFDFFQRVVWPAISQEPLVLNWHIKYLCDELQRVMERVFRREKKEYDLLVNIPPGTTKSSICSVGLPAWCWTRDPPIQALCGSHGFDLSMNLGRKFKQVMGSEKYKTLFPEIVLTSEAIQEVINTKGGWRYATSVGTSPIGYHAHVQLMDDLIDPEESLSETVLKTTRNWQMHAIPSRMVNLALCPVVLLMQRLAIGDPSDTMIEVSTKGGTPVRHICLPADINDPKVGVVVRPRSLRKYYIGGMLDPVRLPRHVLMTKRAGMGQYAFAGQFDQMPVPAGGGMFRVDEMAKNRIVDRVNAPQEKHMIKVVRFWDKAGTEKGGAYTVGVKMGKQRVGNSERFWVLDVVRGQWEAAEREKVIKQTAIADGKRVHIAVEREPGSGGKESAQATVRNLAGWIVKAEAPTGNKVARADAFATQVNDGNVWMIRAGWNADYLQELRLFWFGTKDQVDSSSGAFNMLTKKIHVGAF